MTSETTRRVAPRSWATLTLSGAALGLAVTGAPAADLHPYGAGPERLWLAQSEGGEGGEGGEAGEAGQQPDDDSVDWATVDILMDTGLLEGYLLAGVALYDAGRPQDAAVHMKAPGDDVYDDLTAHLADIGAPTLGDDLKALAAAVAAGKPKADVDAAFKGVRDKLQALRGNVAATDLEQATAVLETFKRAQDEYGDAVVDGRLDDAAEYADAWGFVQAARAMAERMAAGGDTPAAAFGGKAAAAIDTLKPLMPEATAAGPVSQDSALFSAAVAQIELAAYGLK